MSDMKNKGLSGNPEVSGHLGTRNNLVAQLSSPVKSEAFQEMQSKMKGPDPYIEGKTLSGYATDDSLRLIRGRAK